MIIIKIIGNDNNIMITIFPKNKILLTLQSGHNAAATDRAFSTTSQIHIVWSKWVHRNIFFTVPITFISDRHIQHTSFSFVDCSMSFVVASVNLLAILDQRFWQVDGLLVLGYHNSQCSWHNEERHSKQADDLTACWDSPISGCCSSLSSLFAAILMMQSTA